VSAYSQALSKDAICAINKVADDCTCPVEGNIGALEELVEYAQERLTALRENLRNRDQ
jgi:hypothetical protein